jgi:hypothetical protein
VSTLVDLVEGDRPARHDRRKHANREPRLPRFHRQRDATGRCSPLRCLTEVGPGPAFPGGPGADYERPEEDAGAPDLVTRFAADLADGTTGVCVGFLATRPGPGPPGLPRGHLGSAGRGQRPLRPHQPVPAQPEHPALHAVEQQFTQIARPRVEKLPPGLAAEGGRAMSQSSSLAAKPTLAATDRVSSRG